MTVNGCYRYLYDVFFLKVKFEDIPLEITIGYRLVGGLLFLKGQSILSSSIPHHLLRDRERLTLISTTFSQILPTMPFQQQAVSGPGKLN